MYHSNMKKNVALFLIIFLISVIVCPLYADTDADEVSADEISVDDLFNQVKENSSDYMAIKAQMENSLINDLAGTSNKAFTWNVNVDGLEYTPVTGTIQYPSVSVSFTSPTYDNGLSFDGRISTDTFKLPFEPENNSFPLRLKAGISKKYEFKSWNDKDYMAGFSGEATYNSFRIMLLNFENRFLSDLITLLTLSGEGTELYLKTQAARHKLADDLANGVVKAGSAEESKRNAEIEVMELSLTQKETALTEKKDAFQESYSTEYVEVDYCAPSKPEFTPDIEKSFTVRQKLAELYTAEQKLEAALGRSSSVTLTASVEPTIKFKEAKAYQGTTINGEFGVAFTMGNLNINLSAKSNYDPLMTENAPWGDGPVISLNGSWSSKPSSVSEKDKARLREIYKDEEVYNRVIEELDRENTEKQQLESLQLSQSLSEAHQAWAAAAEKYMADSVSLVTEVNEYNNSATILNLKKERSKQLLQQLTEYIEAEEIDGNSDDPATIMFIETTDEYLSILYEELIWNIKGRILCNKVEIFNLE